MCFYRFRNKILALFRNLFFNLRMDIKGHVKNLRAQLNQHGDFGRVADQSGVTYAWVIKFARGTIDNPTVENIAKLEAYFQGQHDAA